MIKKTKVIIASLIALSAVATAIPSADATLFANTRNGGGKFSAWYDESVSQKGYTTYFDYARSQWSGISTKVSIGTTTNPTTSTDQYYVSTSIVAGRLGQCITISKTTGEVDPNVKNWDYSMVYIFDNNIVLGGYNNDTNKKNTALHEVGHSIGLAHTSDINSTLRSQSVMTDGSDTFKNRNVTAPSTYDKGELKYKWGN